MKKVIALIFALAMLCIPVSASAMVVDSSGNTADVVINEVKNYDDLYELSDQNLRMVLFEASVQEEIVPIEVAKKGSIEVVLSYISEEEPSYLNAELYSDKACTKKVGYTLSSYQDDSEPNSSNFAIKKAGTYYLKFSRSSYEDIGIGRFNIIFFDGTDRTLKNKKEVVSYSDSGMKNIYYKVKVDKDGLIMTTNSFQSEVGNAEIVLCDSKKKALSKKIYVSSSNDYISYHAVKKGTYYLKVSSSSGIYSMQYKFTEVKDKSGASKKNATVVKKGGSAVKGIIAATDKTSKADWFKVTLSKKQSVTFEITGDCNGRINMEIVPASGTITSGDVFIYPSLPSNGVKSKGTWSKGTYYIKVYKADAKTSGAYTIKVK